MKLEELQLKHDADMKKMGQRLKEELDRYDCAIILTHHTYFDVELIVNSSKIIIDTRNATKCIKNSNIFKI